MPHGPPSPGAKSWHLEMSSFPSCFFLHSRLEDELTLWFISNIQGEQEPHTRGLEALLLTTKQRRTPEPYI